MGFDGLSWGSSKENMSKCVTMSKCWKSELYRLEEPVFILNLNGHELFGFKDDKLTLGVYELDIPKHLSNSGILSLYLMLKSSLMLKYGPTANEDKSPYNKTMGTVQKSIWMMPDTEITLVIDTLKKEDKRLAIEYRSLNNNYEG